MATNITTTNTRISNNLQTSEKDVKMALHTSKASAHAEPSGPKHSLQVDSLWDFSSCFGMFDNSKENRTPTTKSPVRQQSNSIWNFKPINHSVEAEPLDIHSIESSTASSDDSVFDSSCDALAECSTAASSPPDEDPLAFEKFIKQSKERTVKSKGLKPGSSRQNIQPKPISLSESTKSAPGKSIIQQLLKISNAKLGKTEYQDQEQLQIGHINQQPIQQKKARKNKAQGPLLRKQIIDDILFQQDVTDEEDECDDDLESDSTLRPTGVRCNPTARAAELKGMIDDRIQLTPASIVSRKKTKSPITFTSYQPSFVDKKTIQPMVYATKHDKQLNIAGRLLDRFRTSSSTAENEIIRAIDQVGGNFSANGIHVFVDSSNIAIGFANILKKTRGISQNAYVRQPPLAFDSLALIMERGRGVAKRELVGSSKDNVRPEYMETAKICGYEVSALERVEKWKEAKRSSESDIERFRRLNGLGTGAGYTSGCGSSSDDALATKVITEQGVDEILHMKMLESIVDAEKPATMVLATGDANVAEYSPGFMKMVERALLKGWKVELVAWRESMSGAYRNKAFLKKWQAQFMILELDDFQEDLLALYSDGYATAMR